MAYTRDSDKNQEFPDESQITREIVSITFAASIRGAIYYVAAVVLGVNHCMSVSFVIGHLGEYFEVADDDRSVSTDVEELREQTDEVAGFLLEAMTDEDSRVRNSTKRGLKDVFRTYDSLEDEETIEALAIELEEMATEYSDKRQEHLFESKSDAKFFLQSGFGRLLKEF